MAVDAHVVYSISCDHCTNKLRGERGPDDSPFGLAPLIKLTSHNAIVREARREGWTVEGVITKCPKCSQRKV